MPEPCSSIFGSGLVQDSINESVQKNVLLALEINFDYCRDFGFSTIFIDEGSFSDTRLTEEELRDVITQSKALGVKKIIFSGKEVSSYACIKELIFFARDLEIETDVIKDDYLCVATSGKNDPPFCTRHRFSCVVNSYGYVLPCPGLEIPLGNVRSQKLSDIIKDSEILCDLKDYAKQNKRSLPTIAKISKHATDAGEELTLQPGIILHLI